MRLQHRNLLPEFVDAPAEVPAVRMLCDDAQQHLLTAAADHDRGIGFLYRLWIAPRVGDAEVFPGERRSFFGPHALADVQGLIELTQPRPDGGKLVPVGDELLSVPSAPQSELQTPAADVIDAARHLGHQCGWAISVAGDQRAEAQ